MIKTFLLKRLSLMLWLLIMLPAFSFAETSESISITTYYPAPYGVYSTLRLYPNSGQPAACDLNNKGALYYDSSEDVLKYCNGIPPWQSIGVSGNYWTLDDTTNPPNIYLYTNNSVAPGQPLSVVWNVGIGTAQPNAALQVIGAIAHSSTKINEAVLYGANSNTHVNLGVGNLWLAQGSSVTGESGLDRSYCTVSGGALNIARGDFSTVLGGSDNKAYGLYSTVLGGSPNEASGEGSTVLGGQSNKAAGDFSTGGGGYSKAATGLYSTYLGGSTTISGGVFAAGDYSTVLGGTHNSAAGAYSFIAGGISARTKDALGNPHDGAFVFAGGWSTGGSNFYSKGPNTFNVKAENGVFLHGGSTNWDVAEFMEVLKEEGVGEAELVALKENHKLGKTTYAYDKNLVGVISGKKTTTLHLGNTEPSFPDTERKPVALAGPVFVKVNNQNGNINLGDPVTSSDTPGVGMKATKPGKIIGYAMQEENFTDATTKEILAFVNVGYYVTDDLFDRLERFKTIKKELQDIKQQIAKLNQQ